MNLSDCAIASFDCQTVRGRAVFLRIDNHATLVDIRLTIPNRSDTFLGCHVHEYGNVLHGCKGTMKSEQTSDKTIAVLGSHWNPDKRPHPWHAGDLTNNLYVDRHGRAHLQYIDTNGLLASPWRNIYGRSIVVHGSTDDCGRGSTPLSKVNGNAGEMISCAVIGRSSREFANSLLESD